MTISVQSVQDRCRETAGFLFSHPCKNPAMSKCGRCGKPICAEHARPAPSQAPSEPGPSGGSPDPAGLVCIGCARRQAAQGDRQAFMDDPFFYCWALYPEDPSWSYSAADHAAFAGDGSGPDGGAWEQDWDAS